MCCRLGIHTGQLWGGGWTTGARSLCTRIASSSGVLESETLDEQLKVPNRGKVHRGANPLVITADLDFDLIQAASVRQTALAEVVVQLRLPAKGNLYARFFGESRNCAQRNVDGVICVPNLFHHAMKDAGDNIGYRADQALDLLSTFPVNALYIATLSLWSIACGALNVYVMFVNLKSEPDLCWSALQVGRSRHPSWTTYAQIFTVLSPGLSSKLSRPSKYADLYRLRT
ncbi:predicted protein [Postia placenta Mad-698-R]|nr:predicted protein [Postia placenta Mad-698-R]